MKTIKYSLITLVAFILCATNSNAQMAKSAYFLDGSFYNHQLNPAMKPERAYFSLLTGTWSVAANSNFGLSNFLYPYGDDKLTTFMSSHVDQDEFLNRLPNSLQMSSDISTNLLGLGFRMFGGFTTFGITLNSSISSNLPKGFFEFAKKGFQESSYSFSGINMNTMNYASINLGYSHEIIDGLRVGVTAKYLVGLAYANMNVDKLNIEMSEDKWMIESHATAEAALYTEMSVDAGAMDELNEPRIPLVDALNNSTDMSTIMQAAKPAAKGLAVDLGVSYDFGDLVEGLSVSASLLDLGSINWQYMTKFSTEDGKVEFDGIDEIDPDDFEGSLDKELEALGEDIEKMFSTPYSHGTQAYRTRLSPVMYLGAEYNMPFYHGLSVAMLYGKRFGTYGGWDEVRGYLNIAPLKWIEASANVGYSTYGTTFGWMFNFHPRVFSFFIGSDYMITKVTPQYIPVNNLNSHITFGITKPIGKRK